MLIDKRNLAGQQQEPQVLRAAVGTENLKMDPIVALSADSHAAVETSSSFKPQQLVAVARAYKRASWRSRTSDPVIKSHLLYQLS